MRKAQSTMLGALCCAFFACGPGDQFGKWEPDDGVVQPKAPLQGYIIEGTKASTDVPKPISAEVVPIGDDFPGVRVTCKIPERPAPHALFADSSDVWLTGTEQNDKVCLSKDPAEVAKELEQGISAYALGEGFCRWVEEAEARFRAIADCHATALRELDKLGADAAANITANDGTWEDVKARYVSGPWAMTPEQALADIGHFSGWIALLMDGDATEVPASPFCFTKETATSLRQAKEETVAALSWLHQLREAKQDWVLGGLEAGVKTLVNPDIQPVQVQVEIVITPPDPHTPRCTFTVPGA